jgi:hypothetical protein
MLIARDILANLVNQGGLRESSIVTQENMWAFKAVRLASSISKDEPATNITDELYEVARMGEKHARDLIAYNIIDQRKANFRIDKMMAMNIRILNVFRRDPNMAGNMSIFHCFPWKEVELQDLMSGEELETKLKAKIVSGKVVQGQFETKLAIAASANLFTRQARNFWHYNCFMFGENSWLTNQVKVVAELLASYENEIDSIAELDRDIILILAAMWNNEYHLFLKSCVEANDDITRVRWQYLEDFPLTIRRIIESRTIPNFVFNHTIRLIRDQSREELRRKRALEDAFLNRETAIGGGNLVQVENKKPRNNMDQVNKGPGDDDRVRREEDPDQTFKSSRKVDIKNTIKGIK